MAEGRVRLGFVSGAHLHTGGLLQSALACDEAEVVGLAEEDTELRDHLARRFPGLAVFASSEELYAAAQPEAIITCADNRHAATIVEDAAARGLHVMKEKPLAATLELGERMLVAAAWAGVRLMVNWPINWQPALHFAKQLVDDGHIGDVWQVRYRAGHGGPPRDYRERGPVARVGWGWLIDREQNGGGALIDFCSYGAALSRWLMGQPTRVVAVGGRYSKDFFTVEDNAVIILRYHHGHSICEGTWTQPATPLPTPLVIYGTRGTIAVTGATEVNVAVVPQGGGSATTETLSAPALPAYFASGPAHFVHCILTGEPFAGIVDPDIARDTQEVLDAGLQSIELGTEISLPLSMLG
ncbi:MAG: Gfo/Idh/MocA family oxidoreductase [Chloroflexi bacterium]|nr:Gfo/Idh/MocA family oxidoreductase [Chloroflexota bacterium]